MRRHLLSIGFLCLFCLSLGAKNVISVPLQMSFFTAKPQDGPTGSTPDPTDPNQFAVSLSGSTLSIQTQPEAVSFVVVQNENDSRQTEECLSGLSYDTISCAITKTGLYSIRIGCWKTNFIGRIMVKKITLTDINGRSVTRAYPDWDALPPGWYVLCLETDLGITASKFYKRQ